MKALTREQFAALLKEQRVRPRLVRELRFVPEAVTDWAERELLAIGTRSGTEGVLLIQAPELYLLPYQLTTKVADKATGRSRPITCDFCYSWQRGSNAGRITFHRRRDDHSFTFLCCADLDCSRHVRGLTPEATLSRTQLHEDITPERRIARLTEKLSALTALLEQPPIAPPE